MIKEIDLQTDISNFRKQLADCVILTFEGKILFQKRNRGRHVDFINPFGGHVEYGETPIEALIRELREEVGARVDPDDVMILGAIAEDFTNYSELVHVYFWHDKRNTITGCYECEAINFDSVGQALAYPKIMEYAVWALEKCRNRGLLR